MTSNALRYIACVVFAVVLPIAVNAQTPQVASVVHFQHTIESTVLGEKRTILVHIPPTYARSNKRYPVVYMTDAHAPQNAMMAGIAEQQAWGGMMPEVIIVGLQNIDRSRDLTPTNDGKGGRVGGADKFLRFIETEVIPLVERDYRTQPFRLVAGHSLGGLFAVYSFVARPDLFNAYIAASPVLHRDDNFVVKRAAELLKQDRDWKKSMFISIADEPDYLGGFNAFQDLLRKSKPKNFAFEFRQFKDENHASGVLPAYYAGFRKIFEGWTPPVGGTIADLENHYKKLSARFGYPIPVPEDILNRAAYAMLNANRFEEAIALFKKNVATYPDSANVYDSLGDAYERNGQFKLAAENYERAFKMAEASGETQLASVSRQKLERVRAKMK
ncbi:MAG: tetratricopeptide repeat protein [Acidobacteria bacterium]|nr:tetratricopeptide repeat protein [Acidobacteriota bacterium]